MFCLGWWRNGCGVLSGGCCGRNDYTSFRDPVSVPRIGNESIVYGMREARFWSGCGRAVAVDFCLTPNVLPSHSERNTNRRLDYEFGH
jgi:hypothetical protein